MFSIALFVCHDSIPLTAHCVPTLHHQPLVPVHEMLMHSMDLSRCSYEIPDVRISVLPSPTARTRQNGNPHVRNLIRTSAQVHAMHKHFMDRHKRLMVKGWHAMCRKWDRIVANEQSDGEHRLNRGPRHL